MMIKLTGTEKLASKLRSMNEIRFNAVCLKNLTQLRNRAVNGGTPVDTGELRMSAGITTPSGSGLNGEMGYTKDYAPHVEYGHRTLSGGFVQGQHFLRDNVETQKPIFKQDLIEAIRKG